MGLPRALLEQASQVAVVVAAVWLPLLALEPLLAVQPLPAWAPLVLVLARVVRPRVPLALVRQVRQRTLMVRQRAKLATALQKCSRSLAVAVAVPRLLAQEWRPGCNLGRAESTAEA